MKNRDKIKEDYAELEEIEKDLEEIKALDTESNFRKLIGKQALIITILGVAMCLFQLYTAGNGLLNARFQRGIHLAFALALIFLLYPATKKSSKIKFGVLDIAMAFAGVGINLYLILNYQELAARAGRYTTVDMVVALIGCLIVLEAGRRVIGLDLPILGIIFLLYSYFGPYLPGFLAHRGYSVKSISTYMFFTLEGIYSTPLSVAATYVFLFVLFGMVAEKTGLGELFIDIALAVAGKSKGGPAKVSVISSGLMGSINGSSIANTVTTGAFTIPLMKKTGYKAQFAGAVEAAASTGGQIMPPVMGAAAFIMSEFLNMSYMTIIVAAVIPALLYYLAVGVMVHLEAEKYNLKGVERVPQLWTLLKKKGYLLIPMFIIIGTLILGYTPLKAGYLGVLCAIVIHFVAELIKHRDDIKNTVVKNLYMLVETFEQGAKSSLGVTASCAAVGFIVGTCTQTGLGLSFANMTVDLAGSITNFFGDLGLTLLASDTALLFFTLFFTMLACTILGSGIPTTATYIILAMIAAPALTKLGVSPLAAHLFVLYFGVVADLTPPVALAAYAGAGIAGSNPFKTGFTAVKLAMAGFVVPFVFVFSPELLLQDVNLVTGLIAIVTAIIGIVALGAAAEGYLKIETMWYERIVLFISAICLLLADYRCDLAGVLIFVLVIASQFIRFNRTSNLADVAQK